MRDYYKNEWGELWHGDCLEVMDLLEIVGPVADMVLCDPPYGTTACAWDSVVPFEKMWPRVWACTKDRAAVVMTASQPFTTALGASCLDRLKYSWVWSKSRVGDIFNAKNKPLKKHEDVLVFSSGTTANGSDRRMLYHPQGLRDCAKVCKNKETTRAFFAPRPSHQEEYEQTKTGYPTSVLEFPNETGLHPTQKPVALFAYLIQTYTNPGETVLDFCAGSGTTAVAAEMTGRRWVCIEKEEKYCELIAKRLRARRN